MPHKIHPFLKQNLPQERYTMRIYTLFSHPCLMRVCQSCPFEETKMCVWLRVHSLCACACVCACRCACVWVTVQLCASVRAGVGAGFVLVCVRAVGWCACGFCASVLAGVRADDVRFLLLKGRCRVCMCVCGHVCVRVCVGAFQKELLRTGNRKNHPTTPKNPHARTPARTHTRIHTHLHKTPHFTPNDTLL